MNNTHQGLLHKILLEKNWLFLITRYFLLIVMSVVNSCLSDFSDFTKVFSLVKVLFNRPMVGLIYISITFLITFQIAIQVLTKETFNQKMGSCMLILYKTNGQGAVHTLTRVASLWRKFCGQSPLLFVLFLSKSRMLAKPELITLITTKACGQSQARLL